MLPVILSLRVCFMFFNFFIHLPCALTFLHFFPSSFFLLFYVKTSRGSICSFPFIYTLADFSLLPYIFSFCLLNVFFSHLFVLACFSSFVMYNEDSCWFKKFFLLFYFQVKTENEATKKKLTGKNKQKHFQPKKMFLGRVVSECWSVEGKKTKIREEISKNKGKREKT